MHFNQVVGIDLVFIQFGGELVVCLNCLDWATDYQQVTICANKTSWVVLEKFMECWAVVISDQGGEFLADHFGTRLGMGGTLIHHTDSYSPWQNGRTERAGQTFKRKLELVIKEMSITTWEEFKLALVETVNARNQYAQKCGFTPHQRVFGRGMRIPGSLIDEDKLDPIMMQAAADSEMRRTWDIRDQAGQAWMKRQDDEAVKRAMRTTSRSSKDIPGGWELGLRVEAHPLLQRLGRPRGAHRHLPCGNVSLGVFEIKAAEGEHGATARCD